MNTTKHVSVLLVLIYISCRLTIAEIADCPTEQHVIATLESQNLTSPGFPGTYKRPSSCKWIIETDSDDSTIDFEIHMFSLEPSQSCYRDYVTIRDGPWRLSPKLITWCGNKPIGRRLRSTGPSSVVMFQAVTKGDNFPGFVISFCKTKRTVIRVGEKHFTVVHYILGAVLALFTICLTSILLVLVFLRNVKSSRQRHLHHLRILS